LAGPKSNRDLISATVPSLVAAIGAEAAAVAVGGFGCGVGARTSPAANGQ
jgi:hypothetical protein